MNKLETAKQNIMKQVKSNKLGIKIQNHKNTETKNKIEYLKKINAADKLSIQTTFSREMNGHSIRLKSQSKKIIRIETGLNQLESEMGFTAKRLNQTVSQKLVKLNQNIENRITHREFNMKIESIESSFNTTLLASILTMQAIIEELSDKTEQHAESMESLSSNSVQMSSGGPGVSAPLTIDYFTVELENAGEYRKF